MNRVNSLKKIFGQNPKQLKENFHQYCVYKVLGIYEKYVMPPQNISLRDLKIKEFEDRK